MSRSPSPEELADAVSGLLERVEYRDWEFHVGVTERGAVWLQARFVAEDPATKEMHSQHGRKWLISEHMTTSEIIQTALKAVLTAEEHEARERFLYNGQPIYGPHINVNALLDVTLPQERRTA